MAPPIANDPWTSESGEFGRRIGAITPAVTGGTQVETDEGQWASVDSDDGCGPPGRPRIIASPRIVFDPDLVTMLMAALDVQPNSAENARDITFISCTAPTGSVENIACRPQGSSPLAPSTTKSACRRPPAPVTKNEEPRRTSPVPLAGRNAASMSGSDEILRPSSGISAMCAAASRVPISGSVRTPSTVP